jgi:hypothetical protein
VDGVVSSGPYPVTFRIPSGADLPVRVLSATADEAGARLLIEADPEQWQLIDLVMLFHLRWDVRSEGEVSGDRPVQLELRVDPELVDVAADLDLPGALAGLDPQHPLLSTQSWYALEATEAVDLPPSLAGKGELRSGFSTTWRGSTGGDG